MRCRARIEKEDYPAPNSIRFRNPFRIPTASRSPFFACVLVRPGWWKTLRGQDTGHQSFLSSLLVQGVHEFHGWNSFRSIRPRVQYKRPFSGSAFSFVPGLPSAAAESSANSNIPLGENGGKEQRIRRGQATRKRTGVSDR